MIGALGAAVAIAPARATAVTGWRTIVRTSAGDFDKEPDGSVLAFRGIGYGRAAQFRAPVAERNPGRPIAP